MSRIYSDPEPGDRPPQRVHFDPYRGERRAKKLILVAKAVWAGVGGLILVLLILHALGIIG